MSDSKSKSFNEIESVSYYRYPKYTSLLSLRKERKMHNTVRVTILILGIFIIPSILLIIPLYLRNKTFAEISIAVSETDVLQITDGISTFFCQAQILKMNSSFNAFQIDTSQKHPNFKKQFKLHKNMLLQDDTIEYWAFYLNAGSSVKLSLCSKYSGGKIMIAKDIKNINMCGLLENDKKFTQPSRNKIEINDNVHLTFDTMTKEKPDNSNEYEGEYADYESVHKKIVPQNATESKIESETFTDKLNYSRRLVRSIPEKKISTKEGFLHGKTNETDDSSTSSFENTLLSCHEDKVLLNNDFKFSQSCTNIESPENNTHTQVKHEITSDGYYYYIFYSDNDDVINEVHVVFDIHKPTYESSNFIRKCINQTECIFPLEMFSMEKVIVEIPIKDQFESRQENVTILVSACQPRTLVYIIFPTAVLILILIFSFI